jgi:hypothetical protein
MHRGPGSQAAFADEIPDLQPAERDAFAHCAQTARSIAGTVAINAGRVGWHQLGDDLAAPGDDDLFAGFDPIEQLAEFGLSLERSDLPDT